ncbi:MAG: signal peptide peptidase SppA, partial [Acidobacteria bacterium]|nr:signal peptide peptidase SppA [Acidobacteriota bacterium]
GAPSRAVEQLRLIQSLRETDSVRSVVIDIDSPGGTVAASDYLYRSVRKLAEKKPVIAFIRGTGASGGYMVGCAATKIVALPTAMIGSIGVISMRPLVYELLDKVGVRMSVTKSGRLKDMWSSFREPTEEEKEKEQALLDEFYNRFIEVVAEGRKLSPDDVRALATGEVFTAVRGKEMRLVDELGDLDTAIDMAAELGKAPRRIRYVRPKRNLRSLLMSRMASALVEEVSVKIEESLRPRIDYRRTR